MENRKVNLIEFRGVQIPKTEATASKDIEQELKTTGNGRFSIVKMDFCMENY